MKDYKDRHEPVCSLFLSPVSKNGC